MTDQKCVVEGCNLEYDVVCSFSFYNVNSKETEEGVRQDWIEGAMHEQSECLWRHVSLQLCGYHFEMDSQGLWIDSPMLPELLADQEQNAPKPILSEETKRAADVIRMEHNYSTEPKPDEPVSRLNVRQLVDTLGYLSLKNLQRKQLWVVKVEANKAEASISQSEQVIAKMQEQKQIIEIIPHQSTSEDANISTEPEVLMEEGTVTDDFVYEIAEEQEITMDEVSEIPTSNQEWTVNIVPEEQKRKFAFIKHCNSGKKKRHFTADIDHVTLQGDYENYYILPDADPSIGVEVTTSYEPENYIVDEYQHLVLEERPRKRSSKEHDPNKKRKKKMTVKDQVKQIKAEMVEDWVIPNNMAYDQDESDDYDPKGKGNASRVRRKNKKYDYDFVT